MSSSSFPWLTIEEIVALPPEEISAALNAVQKRRRTLADARTRLTIELEGLSSEEVRAQVQEQRLSQALMLHHNRSLGLQGAEELVAAMIQGAPRARASSLSANVLTIVRQRLGASVTPQDVKRRLAESGLNDIDDKVIRQALRRWAEKGAIVKDGRAYRSID